MISWGQPENCCYNYLWILYWKLQLAPWSNFQKNSEGNLFVSGKNLIAFPGFDYRHPLTETLIQNNKYRWTIALTKSVVNGNWIASCWWPITNFKMLIASFFPFFYIILTTENKWFYDIYPYQIKHSCQLNWIFFW